MHLLRRKSRKPRGSETAVRNKERRQLIMEQYVKPEMKIVELEADVVTISGCETDYSGCNTDAP